MRVLLVEPHEATAEAVEMMFKAEGWNVDVTDLGEDAVELALNYDYDAVVIDTGLPDVGALDVIRRLRAAKNRTPVIVVSAVCGVADRVKALNVGADDFLMKPFHKDELVARIHAVVRRSKGYAQSVITVDELSINLDTKAVLVDGKPVKISGREYQILEVMALRKGKVLTKEMFLNHLYGGMDEPELKIIDVFVCKIRRKLAEACGRDGRVFIETVWGRGYVMRERDVAERLAA